MAQGLIHTVLGLLPWQDYPRVALDAVPGVFSQDGERPPRVVGRGDHDAAFRVLAEGEQRRGIWMLEAHTIAAHLEAGLAEAQLAKPSGHLTIVMGVMVHLLCVGGCGLPLADSPVVGSGNVVSEGLGPKLADD